MPLMLPPSIRVKLENLAEMTGWGVTTLREAAKNGELGVKRRGQWVASLDEYDKWLNAETGQQRRDDQENTLGKVEGGGNDKRQVGKRTDGREKVGSVARTKRKDRPVVVYELDGKQFSVEASGRVRGER